MIVIKVAKFPCPLAKIWWMFPISKNREKKKNRGGDKKVINLFGRLAIYDSVSALF